MRAAVYLFIGSLANLIELIVRTSLELMRRQKQWTDLTSSETTTWQDSTELLVRMSGLQRTALLFVNPPKNMLLALNTSYF